MVLPLNHYDIDEKTGDYDTRTQREEMRQIEAAVRDHLDEDETDIQCSHCGLELRPENALMHEGEPFCDEFCRDTEIEERREKIPFGAGLHQDGTIHIYIKEKDSGLSVGLLEDETLVVKVDESMRTMIAGEAT
jgi:hypothetical protein